MKWRCTWCGKPHESNDPPCDNCGHGRFEEAIVREREYETVDTGTQYVWVCANCGRQHVKNNPPCSRCGGHDLEKTELATEEFEAELEAPSWFEVAKPYSPIVLGLIVVVALFATGVVPLSAIVPDDGASTPPDAPGDGALAAGVDLEEVEDEVHDRLDDQRLAADGSEREYDDELAGLAEYVNRQNVVEHEGGTRPDDPEPGTFDLPCAGNPIGGSLEPFGDVGDYDGEATLADELVDRLTAERAGLVLGDYGWEGLDVHVVDGTIFVFYAAC